MTIRELLEKSAVSDKAGNVKNMLGISDDKNKIKFDTHFGQKEFREYVDSRADHMCDTGYVQGGPDDFNWHYEPEFQLEKLLPLKKDRDGWIRWFEGEMHEWRYDHGDERAGHFEAWAKNPYPKPLIIIEGTD